jgi:cytidylate kinase
MLVPAPPVGRAGRRAAELRGVGQAIDEAAVLADIRRRDARDTTRAVAPLKPAPDAHLLDTTHLDIDAAIRAAVDIVEAARARMRTP